MLGYKKFIKEGLKDDVIVPKEASKT